MFNIERHRHKHHIIPKHEWKRRFGSLIGINATDNLVWLSTEQHAECHKWLFEHYGAWQDRIAYEGLCGMIGHEDAIKKTLRLTQLGKPKSEETKQKIRNTMIGFKHSDEVKKKRGKSMLGNTNRRGKPSSSETKAKVSLSLIGNTRGINAFTGKFHTPETKLKMSLSRKAYLAARTTQA
jgi:hypothetical protein